MYSFLKGSKSLCIKVTHFRGIVSRGERKYVPVAEDRNQIAVFLNHFSFKDTISLQEAGVECEEVVTTKCCCFLLL